MESLTLDELAARFGDATLPHPLWTHAAHLRVGAWHVHHHGPEAALAMLRVGIRRLNESHGTPNSPTSGYHETITVAYVRLIDEFLAASRASPALSRTLEARVDLLMAGPLADRSVLFRFWSKPLLTSAQARLEWVPPDLAPLALPPDVLREF